MGNYGVGGGYVLHMDRNNKKEVDSKRNTLNYAGDLVASALIVLQAPEAGIMQQCKQRNVKCEDYNANIESAIVRQLLS